MMWKPRALHYNLNAFLHIIHEYTINAFLWFLCLYQEWDDELAAAAQSWSKKCNPYEEEPIGNVGKWNSVGRNSVIQSELAGAVAYWMEESNIYKHNTDSCSSTFDCNSYKQEWDDELAAAAQSWSKKCNPYEEEPIGNVGKWNSVGRNSVIQSELAG
ncbi:unnamed protein product [Schistosoma rodhaini]|uniref:SCP domain-containing protein n=1 Tax=Schistosoma rodhaini TaxID=6188 RepID=A0AA85GCM7_9TREM|nr:unnamed protein product [Schistosoma rodhaini]